MSWIRKYYLWIICGMIIGGIIGNGFYNYFYEPPKSNKTITFCDMNEDERFNVCPLKRIYREFPTGGAVILYKCNNNIGYYETRSLSAKTVEVVQKELAEGLNAGIVHKKVCNTPTGRVYLLAKVLNGRYI